MRCLLLVFALLLQGEPVVALQQVVNPKPVTVKFKDVTVTGFFWQLRAMYEEGDCQVLDVVLFGRHMDVRVIAYDGSNSQEIEKAFDHIYNGDKVLIEAKKRPTTLKTRCFIIKK